MANNNDWTVPNLTVPSLSVPKNYMPNLQVPQLSAPGKSKRTNYEKLHVKDLGDVLLGGPMGTRQLQNTLEAHGYDYLEYVPLINKVVGANLLIQERTIDPLLKGDYMTAGINTLESLGSSMDILSNPIKALMPWAGGGSGTDVLRAMGWAGGEYRQYYQWDTGNFAVDFVGEMLSDPAVIVSLAKGVVGGVVKEAIPELTEEVTQAVAKATSKEITEKIISKEVLTNLTKQMTEATADESTKIIEKFIDTLVSSRSQLVAQLNSVKYHSKEWYMIKEMLNNVPANPQEMQALAKEISNLRNAKLYRIYDAIRSVKNVSDNVDKYLLYATSALNPIAGVGGLVIKKVVSPTFKAAYNSFISKLKNVSLDTMTPAEYLDLVKGITINNGTIHRPVYSTFENVFEDYNLKQEDLVDLYVKTFNDTPASLRDNDTFDEIFKEKLLDRMPRLKVLVSEEDIANNLDPIMRATQKEALNKGLLMTSEKLDDLVQAVSEAGTLILQLNDIATASRIDTAIKGAELFWKKQGKVAKGLQQINLVIKEIQTKYPDFKLEELMEFLSKLQYTNQNDFLHYTFIFNYMGVTKDNIKEVTELISKLNTKDDAEALRQLKDLLVRGKTGWALTKENIDNNKKYMNNLVKRIRKDYTINVFDLEEDNDALYGSIAEAAKRAATQEARPKYLSINTTKQELIQLTDTIKNKAKQMPNYKSLKTFGTDQLLDLIDSNKKSKFRKFVKKYMDLYNQLGFDIDFDTTTLLHDNKLKKLVKDYDSIMNNADYDKYMTRLKRRMEYLTSGKHMVVPVSDKALKSYFDQLENFPNLLTTLNTNETVANVKDLLATGEDLFIYKSVEHGELITVTSNLAQANMDPDIWNVISDMNSPFRANLKKASAQLTAGITPDTRYRLVSNLHRDGEQYVLSSVDANGEVLIKQGITKKEFFNYLQGLGPRTATAQRNRAVFQQIIHDKYLPISYKEMQNLIKTKDDINYFLYQYELSHIKNKDYAHYAKELMDKKNIKIEKRAVTDAFNALRNQKQRINIAYYIDTALSTIDGTNNINRLLGNVNVLDITDNKEMRNYLQGLMYNMVYKYRDYMATTIYNDVLFNNIVDEFAQQAFRDNKVFFEANPELLTKLKNNFENAFSDYLKTQVFIGTQNNTNMKLLQTWNYSWFNDTFGNNRNASQVFTDLGLAYKPVIESLIKAKADAQVILDTSTAIRFLTDNMPAYELQRANQKILEYARKGVPDTNFNKFLEAQLNRNYIVTLSKAIEDTEIELAKVNKRLTQSQNIAASYWSQHGEEQAKNAIALIYASETDKFTQLSNLYQNRYNNSTANQFLGYKKVYSQKFMTENKIRPEDLPNVTNKGYNLFYHKMENAAEAIRGVVFDDVDELNVIRNSLINLFMDNPTLEFAPKDPLVYFSSLTPEQLKMWDITVTDNNLGIVGANHYRQVKRVFTENRNYTYSQKIHYRTTPESNYVAMRDAIQRNGVSDAAVMYKTIRNKLDTQEAFCNRGAHNLITSEFGRYIRDPETLGKYRTDIDNAIQNDLVDYNKLRKLDILIDPDNNTPVANVIKDRYKQAAESYLKQLEQWGVRGSDGMTSGPVRMFFSQERNNVLNQSYMNWNAFQLRDYIDRDTYDLGFVVYKVPDYLDARKANLITKFTTEELSEAGLEVIPLKNNNMYIIKRTTNEILGKATHPWIQPRFVFKQEQKVLTDTIRDLKKYFRQTSIPDDLFLGASITNTDLENILKNEEIAAALGDIDVSKILEDKRPILNTIFIGDLDCYNSFFYNTDMKIPNSNIVATPMTNVADRELWTTATLSIDADNATHKLMQVFWSKDFDSNNALYRTVFKNSSDKEVEEIFKRNNWVACVLRQDKKGKPKVYKYYVHNKKTLNQARELGAIIVPHESYRTMVLTINKHAVTNKALRNYLAICAMYKSIYLTTPGFLLRNEWDSNYIKNLSSAQGVSAFMENINYRFKARKLNEWYEKAQAAIADLAEADINERVINKYYTKKYLATLSEADQKLYVMLDMFNRSPASAGLSETMQEILFQYNDANGVINRTAMEKWLNATIYDHGPIKWVRSVNDSIERDARLSLFLNLTENGLEPGDAIRKIIDTHFDYDLSAFQLKPVEQLMWFSVFPFNNVSYYLNEGITKNIDVLKMQLDMLEQSWNSDGYSWEDVRNNRYYFYNVMAGNIRFRIGDQDILLKLGSSVMDFFQLLANPTGALKDRINPFLAVPLGLEDVTDLNPFTSVESRYKQIKEERSLLPSVYTKLQKTEYRPRRRYLSRYSSGGSSPRWTKYPKKIPRPSAKAKNNFKVINYRYYFGKGKNLQRWLETTTAIEPHWYHNNYRYRRVMRKYLSWDHPRQLKHLR